MTDKEKSALSFLQIAQAIKADKTVIDFETANTLYNLINRQKAEIERNREIIEYHEIVISALEKSLESEKTEAIREFAELVKENHNRLFNIIYSERYFSEMIDELVEEMTEGGNG
jgi:mevalonate kinase